MGDSRDVQHEGPAQRFVIARGGEEAMLRYRRNGSTIDLSETFVPPSLRGQGLAEQLCRAAFEYAKAERLTVIPSCSYISRAYLKRHPEYEPLTRSGGSGSVSR